MEVVHYSTQNMPDTDRLSRWNDLTSSYFPGMVVDASKDILASWQAVNLGSIQLCVAKAPKSRVSRWATASEIENTGRSLFHLQKKGIMNTIQDGLHMPCSSGELAVCHSDIPYEIEVSNNNECLIIDCPDDVIKLDGMEGRVISSANNFHLGLLSSFVQNIFKQNWQNMPPSAEEEEHLQEALIALLKNCVSSARSLSDSEGKREKPLTAQQTYKQAIEFIEQHFTDSSLRTGFIAARVGVPKHVLQKVFAEFGTTPTAYIHEYRMRAAKSLLEDPLFDGSMTDLAYDLGFSDSAHFCRRFKSYFKMTPSEFQQRLQKSMKLAARTYN